MDQHQSDTHGQAGWSQIILIYCLGVLAATAVSEAVPVLSAIGREFHPPSRAAVGWVMSLPALVVALGALATGAIVDRRGDRPVLLFGTCVLILGDIGVVLAPTLLAVHIARVVAGIGYVCMAVSAVTMMARITSGRRRTTVLALWATFVPVSFIIPFLAAGLIAASGDWRWAFGGHAILLALLLFIAIWHLPASRPGDTTISRTAGLSQVLRSPWPYALGISFAADAFMQTGILASLAHYLSATYGASESGMQLFNAIAMVFNIIGCLATGVLLNRGVAAWAIGATGVVLSAVAALGIFVGQIGVMPSIVASWLFTFGSGLLVGMWALLPRVAPSSRSIGATSGLVTQVTLIGVLFGPPAVFMAQASGVEGMAIFLLCSLAVCLVGIPVWTRAATRGGNIGIPIGELSGVSGQSTGQA